MGVLGIKDFPYLLSNLLLSVHLKYTDPELNKSRKALLYMQDSKTLNV